MQLLISLSIFRTQNFLLMKTFANVLALTLSLSLHGAAQNSCALKFGSSYFINCAHLIVVKGEDLFTLGSWEGASPKISFSIYSSDGKKVGEVQNGKLITGNSSDYTILSTASEFTLNDKRTSRIIFYMKKVPP